MAGLMEAGLGYEAEGTGLKLGVEGELKGATGSTGALCEVSGVKIGVGHVVADYLLGALGKPGAIGRQG